MKKLKTLARRALGLCLAALLVVPVLAAEPLTAKQRQEDLAFLYDKVLVGSHPDAFANTPESEFLARKAEIEKRLETAGDTEFLLDLIKPGLVLLTSGLFLGSFLLGLGQHLLEGCHFCHGP